MCGRAISAKLHRVWECRPPELFSDEDNAVYLCEKSEVWLVKISQVVGESRKGCVEGYIKALIEGN